MSKKHTWHYYLKISRLKVRSVVFLRIRVFFCDTLGGLLRTYHSADYYLSDSQCRHGIRYRHSLRVLATGSYRKAEVGSNHINRFQHLRSAAYERSTSDKIADLPVLDQISLLDVEDKITRNSVNL